MLAAALNKGPAGTAGTQIGMDETDKSIHLFQNAPDLCQEGPCCPSLPLGLLIHREVGHLITTSCIATTTRIYSRPTGIYNHEALRYGGHNWQTNRRQSDADFWCS